MKEQLIIALGREHGSAGRVIAEKLAEHYQIDFYDSNLLKDIADQKDVSASNLQKYDEHPRHKLFTRTVRGHSSSPEENIANLQFDFLKQKADAGESFVIVGRCAEYVLRDNPNMVSVFVLGDAPAKIAHLMERYQLSEKEATGRMEQCDKKRKAYHNHYCPGKWGDSRSYELCINSSKIGLDETVRVISEYVDSRRK